MATMAQLASMLIDADHNMTAAKARVDAIREINALDDETGDE